MARRRVTKTGKDDQGDITKLCNPGQPWSPRFKADAISDIENNLHQYFVAEAGHETDVQVISGQTGKYLRTIADSANANNLDNLPDC